MARTALFVALCLATAAAFSAPQSALQTLKSTAVKAPEKALPAVIAGAAPAALIASPAMAALPSVAGIPGGVLLTFFPIVIAATVALLVIGPGAIQQFQRVFSGQSSKYMKGDY